MSIRPSHHNFAGNTQNTSVARMHKMRERFNRWERKANERKTMFIERQKARIERYRNAFKGSWISKTGLGLMAIWNFITNPPFFVKIEKRPAVAFTAMLPFGLRFGRRSHTSKKKKQTVRKRTTRNRLTPEMLEQRQLLAGDIVLSTTSLSVAEAAGTATFEVSLSEAPSSNVFVTVNSSDTGEATTAPTALTFTAANWAAPQTVTVTGVNDDVDDGDQNSSVNLASFSTDADFIGVVNAVSVTTLDDDVAGISLPAGPISVTEGGTGTIGVSLTSQPTADVTIDVSSDAPGEGMASPATLTFTAANWNTPQNVTVSGVDDDVDDGDQTANIVFDVSSVGDATYNAVANGSVAASIVDNDTAGITVTAISGNTTEAGGDATFTVVLDTKPTGSVTIDLTSSDPGEGTVSPAVLTFDDTNWDTAQTVTVTGVDDAIADGDQPYAINLVVSGADANYDSALDTIVAVTNEDDGDAPGVTVTAIDDDTSESGGTATFGVALDTAPTANVTVTIGSDNALEGVVTTGSSLVFTAANWNIAQSVEVTGQDDFVDDGDVDYNLDILTDSTDPDYDELTGVALVTNVDDDVSGVTVSAVTGAVTEAGGMATFTVVLTSEPTGDVTITPVSSDPSEATVGAPLVFNSTNWDMPQMVTVTGQDDFVVDGDTPFDVTLTSSSSDSLYNTFTDTISLTNVDNDAAGISVTAITGNTSEMGAVATFTIKLDSEPTSDVTFNLVSDDTSEGTVSPAAVVFTSSNWNVAKTITVTGVQDLIDDDTVAFNIDWTTVSGDTNYGGQTGSVEVLNEDDDVAALIVDTTPINVSEDGTSADISVVLATEPTADVTIDVLSSDIDEASVSVATLTFTPANWNTAQTVTVTGVDDALLDGPQPATVTLNPSSSDLKYDALATESVSVTNADNDMPGVTVTPTPLATSETGTTDSFTVVLDAAPATDVVIDLTNNDTSEGTLSVTSLTFTTANWDTAQTVTVTGVDDDINDGDVSYTIDWAVNAASSDDDYDAFSGSVTVVNANDGDAPDVTVSPVSGDTSEDLDTVTFTVVLDSEPIDVVVLTIGSSDTTEGVVTAGGTLTFTAANWNMPQTVTVTGVEDSVDDGDVDYNIDITAASTGDTDYDGLNGVAVLTNLDNGDVAGINVVVGDASSNELGGTAEFTITLDTEPVAPVTFDFTTSDATEAAAPASVVLDATNWNAGVVVTVTGLDDEIDDGSVAYTIGWTTTGADAKYAGQSGSVSLTNDDDGDTAGVTITGPGSLVTKEDGTANQTFDVVLDREPVGDVTIFVSSDDTTEGTVDKPSLTFTAANWFIAQTVTITGEDDAIADGDKDYNIAISSFSSDPNYNGITNTLAMTNEDDADTAGLLVSSPSPVSTDETGTMDSFTVALTSQPLGEVTVDVVSEDTTEGTVDVATLTFTAANWATPQTVTVTGQSDAIDDGTVFYDISLTTSSTADPTYDSLGTTDVAAENVSFGDTAGITVSAISNETSETGTTATFTVVLESEPTNDVDFAFFTTDASEGTVAPAMLTFNASNWNVEQTVTVTGVNDFLNDGDIDFDIQWFSTSTDANYVDNGTVAVTNLDQGDTPGITLTNPVGNTTEAGGSTTFTVVLDSQPTFGVLVVVESSNADEGVATTSTVEFTTANWNVPQTVTITGVDDDIDDGDVDYEVTATALSADTDYQGESELVTLTNEDDDTAGIDVVVSDAVTDETGNTASFTITLDSEPTEDVVFDFTSSDTTEADAPASVTLNAGNWNTGVVVTVTGKNDSIADGTVAYTIDWVTESVDPKYDDESGSVSLTNEDDADTAGITVSTITGNTSEAGTSANFSVKLDSQPLQDVTVTLTSDNTAEGTVSPATLTFTAANWNVAQIATVTGVNDDIDDGDVSFNVGVATSSTDAAYNAFTESVAVVNQDNDTAGITVTSIGGDVDETGATQTFTVVLDTEPTAPVTFDFTSSDATEGVVSPASVTFDDTNWSTPVTVTVTGVNDDVVDGDQPVTISWATTSADPLYDAESGSDSLNNMDDDVAGITVSETMIGTSELGTTANFTVKLDSEPVSDVTINVVSGDVGEGTVSVSTLTFTPADWDTEQTVTVTGVDDNVADGPVTFDVDLNVVTSGADYTGQVASVAVTNTDDDTAGVTVTPISGNTTEAGGTATFSVVLTSQPTGPVLLSVDSSDVTEGNVDKASLTFNAANWNVPQIVTVTGVDDAVADGDEAYQIDLEAFSTDGDYDGFTNIQTLANIDDDIAGISVTTSGDTDVDEAGTLTKTISVVLNSEPTDDVEVAISSSDPSEGVPSVTTHTFNSGNWNIPLDIDVSGVDDDIDDGDANFTIDIGFSSVDSAYGGESESVAVTNLDDDIAGISVSPGSVTTGEDLSSDTFTVVLDSEPSANVTITLVNGDTTEGSLSTTSLTFTPADWDTPQAVTVTGVDDLIDDGDVTYSIAVDSASTDPKYGASASTTVDVTNQDDTDLAGVNIGAVSGNTEEDGTEATFEVSLNSEPTGTVIFTVSSSDATEGMASPATLEFTPANWNVPQTVTVTGVNDDVDDDDVAYAVNLEGFSADAKYQGLTGSASLTNLDDDEVGITASAISQSTTEAGGTGTFTVVLDSEPTDDVIITVASDDTSEGTASPATLTFTAANWNSPQTVTVTGVDDVLDDGDVAFNVTLDAASTDAKYDVESGSVAVTNTDDDAVGLSISPGAVTTSETGTPATIEFVLNTPPTANVLVTLTNGDPSEGTLSTTSFTFTPANWNVPKSVVVTGLDDAVADGDVAYNISVLTNSSDPSYHLLSDSISVTNQDDDSVSLNVSAISGDTSEAGDSGTFTVSLGSAPTADVTVSVVSSNTDEGTVDLGSLTFTPANWNVAQTVTVAGVDDNVADGDQAYTIDLLTTSVDTQYDMLSESVDATNLEDGDTAGLVVSTISGNTTEASGAATFTVRLQSEPTATVLIAIDTSDMTEGNAGPAFLSFDSSNWNVDQTVTATGVDDAIDDGDVPYEITLGALSGDPDYQGVSTAVDVVNVDDDTAGFTVAPGSVTVSEGGITADFTVVLDTPPTSDVVISVTSSDPGEATVSSSSLTFTPLDWDTPQTVTVTGVDDGVVDGDVTFPIDLVASSTDSSYDGKAASLTVTNEDNKPVGAITDTDSGLNEALEASGALTFIGQPVGVTAFAEDPDGEDVEYSLAAGDFDNDLFTIHPGTGVVTTAAALDAEDDNELIIEVTATSDDGSVSTEQFTVSVFDLDDNPLGSIADDDPSPNAVVENAGPGAAVGITAQAIDLDVTAEVTYSLDAGVDDNDLFVIDPLLGEVTTVGSLNAEDETSRTITIKATSVDGVGNLSVTTQSFSIGVVDVNEFDVDSLVDDDDLTPNAVDENAVGAYVGITALATDADVTTNSITYSLAAGQAHNDQFEIDPVTGEVTTLVGLDYESGATRMIEITATSEDLSVITETFTVSVNDLPDSPVGPVTDIDGASGGAVAEDASIGATVGITAEATDPDGDAVTYTLTGDAGGLFEIDETTGVVTVAGALDFETATSHDIIVTATSVGLTTSTSSEMFTIEVTDVDDTSPEVTSLKVSSRANPSDSPAVPGWSASFMAGVDPDGVGYEIADGETLPWIRLNTISFTFNEDVTVSATDLSVTGFTGNGSSSTAIDYVSAFGINNFSFDSGTNTATWILDDVFAKFAGTADRVLVSISGVTDTAGNALAPLSIDEFNVNPGDTDGSERVTIADVATFYPASLNAVPGDANYNSKYDIDGSGRVTIGDVATFYPNRLNVEVPDPLPPMSLSLMVAADELSDAILADDEESGAIDSVFSDEQALDGIFE